MARHLTSALLLSAFVFVAEPEAQARPEWSLLITGGTVVDGTGGPRYAADVAIAGDRVVMISRVPLERSRAARVIDARGLIVAPGFIDLHAHLEPLLSMPDAKSAVTQGVTLALGGPDGSGPFPLAAYLDSAQRAGLGMNVAYLVGHNTVRREVMGTENRAPTPDELARMIALIRQGMGDGAFGISTGLRYVPGYYSKTDEVVALSRAAADSGGIYTSHLREEGLGLIEGVAEAITIARDARIPVVLTHHKAVGALMWGKTAVTLAMVDSARAAGLDVMVDQYPYTASQTSLSVLIPPWALAGGRNALRERLAQPVLRDSIERGIVELLRTDRGGGDTRRVQFGSVSWDRSLEGKTLYDFAERRGVGPSLEAAAKLVLEGELNGGASMVYHIIDEGDVRRVMQHPQAMVASDGRLTRPGQGVPHPRAYGTFPRVLGHYVREEGVISLETAVHKMTGMPAKRLGLGGQRGCLAAGCYADVAIFDAATVGSPATFENPHQYATGVPYVLVNGVPVVDGGTFTAARPGRALRRPAMQRSASAPASVPRLPRGTPLRVSSLRTDARPVVGSFDGVRGDSIFVYPGQYRAGFAGADVRVEQQVRSRKVGAKRGAMRGVVAGATFGFLAASDRAQSALALAPTGALVGAGIGAMVQGKVWQSVDVPQLLASAGQGAEPSVAVAADDALDDEARPSAMSVPLPEGFLLDQSIAGARTGAKGMAIGFAAGLALYFVALQEPGDGLAALGAPLAGALLGNVIGAPIGVARFSRARGVRGSIVGSYIGSAVGIFGLVGGGIGFFATVPLGAALGYNAGR